MDIIPRVRQYVIMLERTRKINRMLQTRTLNRKPKPTAALSPAPALDSWVVALFPLYFMVIIIMTFFS